MGFMWLGFFGLRSAMPEELLKVWLLLTITTIVSVAFFVRRGRPNEKLRKKQDHVDPVTPFHAWRYDNLKKLIHANKARLPAMFVNLDVFDSNTRLIVGLVRNSGKTLRLATKSIRCPYLIKRIQRLGRGIVSGLMCFSLEEACLLAEEGLDDFFIAYPTLQRCDISLTYWLLGKDKKVTLTVDSIDHVTHLDSMCSEEQGECEKKLPRIGVCIDLDLSYKLLWGFIQFGAHRSHVDSIAYFSAVAGAVQSSDYLKLVGAMGYEAQVAGLPDDNPFTSFPNILIRFLKGIFYSNAVKFRMDVAEYCRKADITLEFFNGGGSGNFEDACADPVITEVTAGSAFLQAKLCDYFVANRCQPALAFALQATRIDKNYIVCQSGGFIASGSSSIDKFPVPFNNPLSLEHYSAEGYGEVQTPLRITGYNGLVKETIQLSDPVFFRPAKSGEIGEHFLEYHLMQSHEIVGKVKTYRGLGYAFY